VVNSQAANNLLCLANKAEVSADALGVSLPTVGYLTVKALVKDYPKLLSIFFGDSAISN